MDKFLFTVDQFSQNRGGQSQMWKLSCANCKNHLIIYQKDGPGPLLRCYLDRIKDQDLSAESHLSCKKCKARIGEKRLYEKECRFAFYLIEGSFLIFDLQLG